MRFEQDEVTLIGGVRHGRTLGSPVAIEIANTEWTGRQVATRRCRRRPGATTEARSPSPGPGTPTSPACRSTASPTPATCSSGPAPARRRPGSPPARWPSCCCAELGVEVVSHVVQIGPGPLEGDATGRRRPTSSASTSRAVRCFDPAAEEAMIAEIEAAAKDGDSLGGVVEVLAYGVPVGLGSHVHWDRKLDAPARPGAHEHPGGEGRRDRRRVRGRRAAGQRGPRPDRVGRRRRRVPPRSRRWPAASRAACRPASCSSARAAMKPLATLNRPVAQDRRHRHQGGDGLVQGAHRRHRGAGHGRGGRDDGGARARRRGAAQVRRRLGRRARAQPRRVPCLA